MFQQNPAPRGFPQRKSHLTMNCIFLWLHSCRGSGCHFVLGSFWLKPNLEEQDDSEVFSNTANCDTQRWWAISAMVKHFLFTLETDSPSGAKLDVNGVPKIGYAWLVPQKHHDANDPTPIQQQFWDMPLEKEGVPCFEIHVYYIYFHFAKINSTLSKVGPAPPAPSPSCTSANALVLVSGALIGALWRALIREEDITRAVASEIWV